MRTESRKSRTLAIGGVALLGLTLGTAFWWGRPFDSYLLHRWEAELSTLPDDAVPTRLEQIAGLGDRSLSTLVVALHSERQVVAENAELVLQRELSKLELRSTDDTSRLVAGVAAELADHSNSPGPYSGPGSIWLATRILLWPIDRKLVDGERLVADCESIIRSAKAAPRGHISEPLEEARDLEARLIAEVNPRDPAELVSPVAGGGLPVQLTETPSLPPRDVNAFNESHVVSIAEPLHFPTVQAPSLFDARLPISDQDDAPVPPDAKPPASDSRPSLGPRLDLPAEPPETKARPDLQSMADFDVIQKLAGGDERLAREAVDELYRRGFQTKHFRLAEILVDPDPNVRLRLVESLPQMSGIDSRPWLLWLSRDQDPGVRKAAVSVIATSSDATLQKRVLELEREETDEEVLQAVRQILNKRQTNPIR